MKRMLPYLTNPWLLMLLSLLAIVLAVMGIHAPRLELGSWPQK